jgi:hypothetical protein
MHVKNQDSLAPLGHDLDSGRLHRRSKVNGAFGVYRFYPQQLLLAVLG